MFDIRDHGGSYGAGKYRKGSKLLVSNTLEKRPLQILSKNHQQSSLLRDCIGEDDTNYYYISWNNDSYLLLMLNKLTDTIIYSTTDFSSPMMAMASVNDGYVYIYTDTTLRKINISTGAQVWSVYLDYSCLSRDSIKIYISSTYVHVFFRNSGITTTVAKVTVDGVKVSNTTISIISKYYYLEGTTLYSVSMNEVTLYKHDITTGNLISQSSIIATPVNAIDYKNGTYGIVYSYSHPNIIAKYINGVQLWSYNISTAELDQIVAMKDGLYVADYSGNDVKLALDGKVAYKNYQPYPTNFERIYHDYGKDYLLGNTYASGSTSYNTPTKVQEYVTIQ